MSTVVQIDSILAGIIDPNTGLPAAGGSVEFYEAGTSTPKNVWTESAKSNPYTSYTLNAAGAAELWADGIYDIVVKNAAGATICTWDGVVYQRIDFEKTTISGNYAQLATDNAIILSSSATGTVILSLLAPSSFPDWPLYVFNSNSTYDITITPPSGTIDGSATYTLSGAGEGVVIWTDGTNYHTNGGAQDSLTAQDGSGRAVTIDEDGLSDNDGSYASAYALLGGSAESARIVSVDVFAQYNAAGEIRVELNTSTYYGYNQPSNVESGGIINTGTDSGFYINGSVLTIYDDILSPSAADDCEIIGVLAIMIYGQYQISTSGPPGVAALYSGTYPSSQISITYYDGGVSDAWHDAINTTGDHIRLQLVYACRMAG
jgi:hypothetical protein